MQQKAAERFYFLVKFVYKWLSWYRGFWEGVYVSGRQGVGHLYGLRPDLFIPETRLGSDACSFDSSFHLKAALSAVHDK